MTREDRHRILEKPNRELVLNQRFIDGRFAEVRVNRVLAQVEEGLEGGSEGFIVFVGVVNFGFQPLERDRGRGL